MFNVNIFILSGQVRRKRNRNVAKVGRTCAIEIFSYFGLLVTFIIEQMLDS